jgi:hypothetical protein
MRRAASPTGRPISVGLPAMADAPIAFFISLVPMTMRWIMLLSVSHRVICGGCGVVVCRLGGHI